MSTSWIRGKIANFVERMKKKTIWEMKRLSVEEFRASSRMPVVLVLDNVRSLNNIGSMFRSADGFAAAEIILCGISAPPPSPEIHKTALGAEESVPWRYFETTAQAIATLREEGYRIACLELVNDSVPLDQFRVQPGQGYAIVVGNEVDGIDQTIVDQADVCLEIPQSGTKHSLNVAISASVALWEFYKQMK